MYEGCMGVSVKVVEPCNVSISKYILGVIFYTLFIFSYFNTISIIKSALIPTLTPFLTYT